MHKFASFVISASMVSSVIMPLCNQASSLDSADVIKDSADVINDSTDYKSADSAWNSVSAAFSSWALGFHCRRLLDRSQEH